MLDKMLLALLVFISPIIGSDIDLIFNPIDDYLCQDVETKGLTSDIFSGNEDASITNSEVISCYSSDIFMLSKGVVEIETEVNSIAAYDALSLIVYKRGETDDSVVVKRNVFLENIQDDDNLEIYVNVTYKDTEAYVLIFSHLSKTSDVSIKSIEFTPSSTNGNVNPSINIMRERLDSTSTIVTIPFPTIGEIGTLAPDTTIVTVPFPTIGQWPTSTPIVTIPFPTVSNIATAEDTTVEPTTIVTVPFPTIGGAITFPPMTEGPTDTTSTIVTIPFPTIGEIGTPESITDSTTEAIEEITVYPDEIEESTGLSAFAIIMIAIGSFAFVIVVVVLAWYLIASKKSLDFKSNV